MSKKLKIGTRLGIGFSVAVGFLCVMAIFAIYQLSNIKSAVEDVVDRRYSTVAAAEEIRQSSTRQNLLLQYAVLSADTPKEAAEVMAEYESGAARNDKKLKEFGLLLSSAAEKDLYGKISTAREKYGIERRKVFEFLKLGKNDEARSLLLSTVRPAQEALLAELAAVTKYENSLMIERSSEVNDIVKNVSVGAAVLFLFAFTSTVIISYRLTKSITGPITRAVEVADLVASGDLRADIDGRGRDEAAALLTSLQTMNVNLGNIVLSVRKTSDNIAVGAAQISSGNVDLSKRTEEQAVGLEQTSAFIKEFSSQLHTNVEMALDASKLVTEASTLAQRGSAATLEVMAEMENISAHSKKISEITDVINGIAFQTNILALNAAVEAARAGDQGRGFAVVATEVRALAKRSASAAKEIATLIQTCVDSIAAGRSRVNETGQMIADAANQVQQVQGFIGRISVSAAEQAAGIEQVNEAMSQLDRLTQHNASLVEESASAADSLNGQAQELVAAVAAFKLAPSSPISGYPYVQGE
jgi:methyl-accepting chemotaxis protein